MNPLDNSLNNSSVLLIIIIVKSLFTIVKHKSTLLPLGKSYSPASLSNCSFCGVDKAGSSQNTSQNFQEIRQ